MGFLVSALMFAMSDDAMPARSVYYGQHAEGWVRSRFIRPGMTPAEVRTIMGRHHTDWLTCHGSGAYSEWGYTQLGVVVSFHDVANKRILSADSVYDVHWGCRPFKP
jgi:hypothetical protein